MSTQYNQLIQCNYQPLLQKVQAVISSWSQPNLSLFGKILIVNSLIGSLFVYQLAVLPDPPPEYFQKLENIIKTFIWNGKRAKININILQGTRVELI